MANDLHVELGTLRDLATSLASMSTEMKDVAARVSSARDAIGAPTVRDAIDDFDDNWKIHRSRMVESIDAVQSMADESEQKFSAADEELANYLLDDSPPSMTQAPPPNATYMN